MVVAALLLVVTAVLYRLFSTASSSGMPLSGGMGPAASSNLDEVPQPAWVSVPGRWVRILEGPEPALNIDSLRVYGTVVYMLTLSRGPGDTAVAIQAAEVNCANGSVRPVRELRETATQPGSWKDLAGDYVRPDDSKYWGAPAGSWRVLARTCSIGGVRFATETTGNR